MSYSEQLDKLAGETERQVSELYAQLDAGDLDRELFLDLVAVLILTGAAQAATLAELSLMAQIGTAGATAAPAGSAPALIAESELRSRLTVALADPTDPAGRVGMVAHSEPVAAAQESYTSAVSRTRPRLNGWRRGLNTDACQLCTWWSRDGQLWPVRHKMPTHKGCLCAPVIVGAQGAEAIADSAGR